MKNQNKKNEYRQFGNRKLVRTLHQRDKVIEQLNSRSETKYLHKLEKEIKGLEEINKIQIKDYRELILETEKNYEKEIEELEKNIEKLEKKIKDESHKKDNKSTKKNSNKFKA